MTAVMLPRCSLVPGWVYECCGGRAAMRPTGVTFPNVGEVLCQSGQKSNAVLCGPVLRLEEPVRTENERGELSTWEWLLRVGAGGQKGDSGAPVWVRNTGAAVGLVAGGGPAGLLVQPFERPPYAPANEIAGILHDPYMSPSGRPLHVQLGP
jgi:hypothetical protein